MRVGVYVDGFNAYHAIAALNEPQLKWLDYWSLATALAGDGNLERVCFYTALTPWSQDKRERHVNYITALKSTGVEVVESIFSRPRKWCVKERQYCKNYEEKQTDVAFATDVLTDFLQGAIDKAFLITADSDQIPMVSRIRKLFPDKVVVLVAPPNRLNQARALGAVCSGITEMKPRMLRDHILPHEIRKANGKIAAAIPAAWVSAPEVEAERDDPAITVTGATTGSPGHSA